MSVIGSIAHGMKQAELHHMARGTKCQNVHKTSGHFLTGSTRTSGASSRQPNDRDRGWAERQRTSPSRVHAWTPARRCPPLLGPRMGGRPVRAVCSGNSGVAGTSHLLPSPELRPFAPPRRAHSGSSGLPAEPCSARCPCGRDDAMYRGCLSAADRRRAQETSTLRVSRTRHVVAAVTLGEWSLGRSA